MCREIDRRDFSVSRVTPTRETELAVRALQLSSKLPGRHRIKITRFDPTTGNPRVIVSESAPGEEGNYIQRALEHLRIISPVLGLHPNQPPEFVPDPYFQRTSTGAVAVHLRQHYKGLPIFQAAQTVRFAPDGTLRETTGTAIGTEEERQISPRLSAKDAVSKAARHVAVPTNDEMTGVDQFKQRRRLKPVDLKDFNSEVIAVFPNAPERQTVFGAGPFGVRIIASMIWFPLGDEFRLAWQVIVTMPRYEGQYRTLVDAENGEILYCHQMMKYIAAKGHVFLVDGGGSRTMVNFPRSLSNYDVDIPTGDLPLPTPLPDGFPDDWIALPLTIGNCVASNLAVVSEDLNVELVPFTANNLEGSKPLFDPDNPLGQDQMIVNLFYYNCFIHDYFYLLGFRELDGNFQNNDFNRGGSQGDPVKAIVFPNPVDGTASMHTESDGSAPTMRMGLVESTGRHTAFDSTVVFHEFTHGVTNRLVGGPSDDSALERPQSEGMGEGWGDYFACTINKTTVVGAWVFDNSGGLRKFPYDSHFPDDFGKLGTGRYTGDPDKFDPHNVGEIWCATLMEMNRNIGHRLGVQLVVDALKLSPANPSFLDMRDAILSALEFRSFLSQMTATDICKTRSGIWRTFAKFGMGPRAVSALGAGLGPRTCIPDFNVPALSVDETWSSTWTTGWSSIVPLQVDAEAHYLAYKTNTGDVAIGRVESKGKADDPSWRDKWTQGWSSVAPLMLGGKPNYLVYKIGTGDVAIGKITANSEAEPPSWRGHWTKGWSSLVPFVLDSKQHYFVYKTDTGDVAIGRITSSGEADNPFWRDTWTHGWSAFVPFILDGRHHHLAYKVTTGEMNIDRVRADGKGFDTIHKGTFTAGWTSFAQFELHGQPHQLCYKIGTGEVKIYRIKSDGSGVEIVWEDQWDFQSLWSSVGPFDLSGQQHLLAYSTATGAVAIKHICAS